MKSLIRSKSIRFFALWLLRVFAKDITIRHHWVGKNLLLNTFLHKGYWFYGRSREQKTIERIKKIIKVNSTVIEVGGHIGYLTLIFSDLVGLDGDGQVFVFEPGENNQKYIVANTRDLANVVLIKKGCGSSADMLTLYEDNLTGQNNSFLADFEGVRKNAEYATAHQLKLTSREVNVVRVDSELSFTEPSFIKIDTEGFEYKVLLGCEEFLHLGACRPTIMVEIQNDEENIFQLFKKYNYDLETPEGIKIKRSEDLVGNIFAMPR